MFRVSLLVLIASSVALAQSKHQQQQTQQRAGMQTARVIVAE